MISLLGLPLEKAAARLEEENIPYKVVFYHSYKPYDHPDSKRVIRAKVLDGTYELVISEFKTEPDKTSQG